MPVWAAATRPPHLLWGWGAHAAPLARLLVVAGQLRIGCRAAPRDLEPLSQLLAPGFVSVQRIIAHQAPAAVDGLQPAPQSPGSRKISSC